MGRKKGSLKKQLQNAKSEKQVLKEQAAKLEGRVAIPGGSSLAADTNTERDADSTVNGAATVAVEQEDDDEEESSVTVVELTDDAPDEEGMTTSMKVGEGLIQYARQNNLAVDLETMGVVNLPKGGEQKLAALFPQSTPELRAKYPLGPQPTVEEFVAALEALVPGDSTDVTALKEFLVANRHVGGNRGEAALTQLMLQAQSRRDRARALRMRHLLLAFMKAESAVTGPFRQAIKNAEARLAPNMGSQEVARYGGADAADAVATFLCLKALVAEWEKRYRELTGQEMSVTDVLRAEGLSENKLDAERTGRICGAVQGMSAAFAASERLFSRLTPEALFLERTLTVGTTSEVRRIALQEICPQAGLTPEEFRRRMRGLCAQLESLPRNSYAQLQLAVNEIYECIVEGTPDDYNIHTSNMGEGGALRFATYDLSAGAEPWRRNWHRMISSARDDDEDQDYSALFDSLSSGLGKLFAPPPPKGDDWLYLLDDEVKAEQEQDTADVDGEDGWQNSGNDIYDDFERRYGLVIPQEEVEEVNA
ncbi:hypothetical protein JKP88DRAFT_259405 [Tribonema minus]|uniref:Uncharacterized protein n=1 Tax=Tribonema minus TaxID=303371 RepID=A0A836CQX4_9STRA|nr:hypothetical protein JKP88DRAFT_259405 [Tribonema minus]